MPNITLSMIVKNEEKYLRECLESVKDIIDEIVIVDTGSTDKTIEIAKEFNAKIHSFEWIKDFSAARNFALSKSNGNWILYLDADERVEAKSKKEILRLTKNNKKLGINCIINNLDDNKNAPTLMKYVRLFRNSKNISFVGKAHEQIESSLRRQGYKIIDSTIEIMHLGYNVSKEKLKEKADRNLELLLNEYNEKPTSYGAYQIANSYSVLDDMEQSIYYTKKTLEYENLRKEFKSVCYLRIADYELQKGNLLYAKEIINKGIYNDKNHPLMNLLASQIYKQFNQKAEALNFCKNALRQNIILTKKNKSKNVLDIVIDSKNIIYHGIILSLESGKVSELEFFLEKLKKYSNNECELFIKVLQNKDFDKDVLNELIDLLNEKNLEIVLKLIEVNTNNNLKLEFYSAIYDRFNNNSKFIAAFGSFLINIGQLEEAEIILRTSLEYENIEPSIIFYLISIYVQKGELDKINEVISIGEQLVKNNKTLQTKLNDIKYKLAPMLEASQF
jgi:glycosyltransferase involved in cell wall biosynthesis